LSGQRPAVRDLERGGILADAGGDVLCEFAVGQRRQVPHAQGQGGQVEQVAQAADDVGRNLRGVGFGQHPRAPLHDGLIDAFVAAGVVQQLGEAAFLRLGPVAQREDLALAQ